MGHSGSTQRHQERAEEGARQSNPEEIANQLSMQLDQFKAHYIRDFIEQTLQANRVYELQRAMLYIWTNQVLCSHPNDEELCVKTIGAWLRTKYLGVKGSYIESSFEMFKGVLTSELQYFWEFADQCNLQITAEPLIKAYQVACYEALGEGQGDSSLFVDHPLNFQAQYEKLEAKQKPLASIKFEAEKLYHELDEKIASTQRDLNDMRESKLNELAEILSVLSRQTTEMPPLLTKLLKESPHLQAHGKHQGQNLIALWQTQLKLKQKDIQDALENYYQGRTLLHMAVQMGYVNTVSSILHYSVDLEAKIAYPGVSMGEYPSAVTPLFLACHNPALDIRKAEDKQKLEQKYKIAELLLAKQPRLATGKMGLQDYTCLTTVTYQGQPQDESITMRYLYLLIKHGAEINAEDKSNRTALTHCVTRGLVNSFQYLIQQGADISKGFGKNQTVIDALLSARFINDNMLSVLEREGKLVAEDIISAIANSLPLHLKSLQREQDIKVKRDALCCMRRLLKALPDYQGQDVDSVVLADEIPKVMKKYLDENPGGIRKSVFQEIIRLEMQERDKSLERIQTRERHLAKPTPAKSSDWNKTTADFINRQDRLEYEQRMLRAQIADYTDNVDRHCEQIKINVIESARSTIAEVEQELAAEASAALKA